MSERSSRATVSRRPRMSKLRRREAMTGLAFVAPVVVGLILFMALPLVISLGYSFTHWNLIAPAPTFVGLDNWIALFHDPRIPIVIWNTVKFILFGTTSFLIFSLLAALLTFIPRRFVGAYRAALFLPLRAFADRGGRSSGGGCSTRRPAPSHWASSSSASQVPTGCWTRPRR